MEVKAKQCYHFVLVHGAHHGAWCWYKLMDRLQKGGHQVTALDMAGAGQHPADPNTIATYDQYHQPLTDFFQSLQPHDHKVVVIGHSMGGLSCMQLTERFAHKIGLVIHVATILTPNGVSAMDSSKLTELVYVDTPLSKVIEYKFANGSDKLPTSVSIAKPALLKDIFYTDWDSQDVTLATILVRPVPSQMLATPITCTEKYGHVSKVYIKYLRDNALSVLAQDWIVEHAGPFKEVVEVDGGHFDFHVHVDDFSQLVYKLVENYFNL